MSKRIFYVDRFVRYSSNVFEHLIKTKNHEFFFVGPDDKNQHWLSNQQISNAAKVWTRGHYVRKLYKYIKNHHPDLVHISFELRTFGSLKSALWFPFLLFLLNRTKSKVVVTLHNILIYKKQSKWAVVDDVPMQKDLLRKVQELEVHAYLAC